MFVAWAKVCSTPGGVGAAMRVGCPSIQRAMCIASGDRTGLVGDTAMGIESTSPMMVIHEFGTTTARLAWHYWRGRTAGASVDNEDGPDVSRNPVSEIGDVTSRGPHPGRLRSSG